jgi:hypothetical protein
MDDLFDKLKALGLKIEKAVEIEPLRATATPMDEAVSGRWLNELTQGVYIVEKTTRQEAFTERLAYVFPCQPIRWSNLWNPRKA